MKLLIFLLITVLALGCLEKEDSSVNKKQTPTSEGDGHGGNDSSDSSSGPDFRSSISIGTYHSCYML